MSEILLRWYLKAKATMPAPDEKGQDLVEYAVLAALVLVAIVGYVVNFTEKGAELWQKAISALP